MLHQKISLLPSPPPTKWMEISWGLGREFCKTKSFKEMHEALFEFP